MLGPLQPALAQQGDADLARVRSANPLVAQIASLIKAHAYFNGVSMVFRYDAYADTTRGLKLYIGEEVGLLGSSDEKVWHYIDFEQPIQAGELKVIAAQKGTFTLDLAKRITKKLKGWAGVEGAPAHERNVRLLIPFWTSPKKRTVDFDQLQAQLGQLISQVLHYQGAKRASYGLK